MYRKKKNLSITAAANKESTYLYIQNLVTRLILPADIIKLMINVYIIWE